MTALQFLKKLRDENSVMHMASNSQLQQWLKQGAVVINNKRPNWNEEIKFPITQMCFFPKGKRVTLV